MGWDWFRASRLKLGVWAKWGWAVKVVTKSCWSEMLGAQICGVLVRLASICKCHLSVGQKFIGPGKSGKSMLDLGVC